jgi:predicted Zn-dependent protease with MMP-like domain
MSNNELRELRHNYKAAYTDYMNCVHTLSLASLEGQGLTAREIAADEKAFNALALARRALLDALREHAESASI